MLKLKTIIIFTLVFLLPYKFLFAQIESEKDSLESLLPFAKDNQRVDIYIGLAELIKQTDTTAAINYAKQALKMSNALSYSKGLAGAHVILGYIDRSNGKYKEAKVKYLFAVSYALKSNDDNTIAWAYQNMGNLYFIQSDYTKAMRYYLGALSKGEKANNPKRVALACNQIGSLYSNINDNAKAAFYYNKSYNILKDLGDEIMFARIANNLANIYKQQDDNLRALYHYGQCLEVFRKNNLSTDISTVLNNIGTIYLAKKQVKKAFPFLLESYGYDIKSNDKLNAATSSLNISSAYYEINKLDSAIYYAEQSIQLAKQNNYAIEYADACKQLSNLYNKKGDKEKAFYYLNESNEKQVLSANKGAEIEGVRSEFEKAKKDETITQLDAENKENKLTLIENAIVAQRKNVVLLALICVIVLLCLVTILFIYFLTQKKKRKNLEISSAAKSHILNRINHELRTPLNSLINFSYLANESKNLTELRDFLSGINASGNDLIFSMNNMVSYLQIDAKNDKLVNTPFDVMETLHTIFSTFQIQCKQKNILFSQLISPELPHFILADKDKITSIIQNLLNNALKFSDKGVIKVEIKILNVQSNSNGTKGELFISVMDEGRGLNGKVLKDLVLSNNKKEENNGFGLGLYIVKKYMERLNGTFDLTNNSTTGCKATVLFEVAFDNPLNINKNQLNSHESARPLSLLLVEDDLTNSYTLQKILERKGHKVVPVFKGKEAFEVLATQNIDLVLIDLGLPDMSGLELAKFIRMGGEFAPDNNIPIIALSANADPNEMQECILVGVNEYLTKPILKDLLFKKMEELTSQTTEKTVYINS
ncbi:MAG: tetratricopeptide repeat protein [Bacteroidia bacterium]|nr:tetratricopeptide repeat protein [Bacteroidia bacterium]